jgi:hypothetical protein
VSRKQRLRHFNERLFRNCFIVNCNNHCSNFKVRLILLCLLEHHVTGALGLGRRAGGFSDGSSILSPRSNEAGGLGAKMVEYVLGASPTAKDLETRMRHLGIVSDY